MTASDAIFDPAWLVRATGGRWLGGPTAPVKGICHDTRTLHAGDLYVAIRGARIDGHTLIAEAFEKGAVAALVDEVYAKQHPGTGDVPLLVVADVLPALGRLASMHRHRIGAWIMGITGSMGKTTVKEMTAALLRQRGETVCTRGNWNNNIGLPLSMLAMRTDTQFGVFEIGMNHPGEIRPLSEILTPDWAVITAIGPVHLEFFDSVEDIAREKAELLRSLPASGTAFLYVGDPYYSILKSSAPCHVKTVGVGVDSAADMRVVADRGVLHIYEGAAAPVEMPLPAPGKHNLVNAGLAVLVGRTAGCDWEQIRKGFAAYQSPPMRWEVQSCGPYTVVNDAYNANPVSMQSALDTFRQMQSQGQKWLVLGDMLELGGFAREAHQVLGRQVAAGEWAGMAAVGLHAETVRDAAIDTGMRESSVAAFRTVHDVGEWLLPQLKHGDALLLKGSRGVQLEHVLSYLK